MIGHKHKLIDRFYCVIFDHAVEIRRVQLANIFISIDLIENVEELLAIKVTKISDEKAIMFSIFFYEIY